MLDVFGMPQIAWLTQKLDGVRRRSCSTDVWLWTPWFALLLLAGLQSLPHEPFEAAADRRGAAPGARSATSPCRCCAR